MVLYHTIGAEREEREFLFESRTVPGKRPACSTFFSVGARKLVPLPESSQKLIRLYHMDDTIPTLRAERNDQPQKINNIIVND